VQLLGDHLEIEPTDFEYLRDSWEIIGEGGSFDEHAKTLAGDCTKRIMYWLTLDTKTEKARKQGVQVFFYLFKNGTPTGRIGIHEYIRRKKIEEDLGYCRRSCGRPKGETRYPNELTQIIRRLIKFRMIERKEVHPRDVYYRIATNALGEILTPEERNQRFTQNYFRMMFQLEDAKRRYLAVEWHLTNKMRITKEEIDNWVTEWPSVRGGQDQTSTVEMIGVMPPLTKKLTKK